MCNVPNKGSNNYYKEKEVKVFLGQCGLSVSHYKIPRFANILEISGLDGIFVFRSQ